MTCAAAARRTPLLTLTLMLLSSASSLAQSLPSGGMVAAGSATIHSGPNGITVHQYSSHAVVNWGSFNVGAGNSVTFDQPGASSATLNRVTGTGASSIAGNVTSNGQVFLVNRNGIIVTPTGTIKTGGFVGSTLDITNADFMAGRYNFSGRGAGTVVNQGAITASPGSAVALLGASVSNQGVISAPLGKVVLGSGQAITLDFSGNGVLQVAVPTDLVAAGDQALISNSGSIDAEGGQVVIKAAAAQEAVRRTVNMSGVITAKSVSGHDGSVLLDGGAGGDVAVSGRIDASGESQGGQIDVTGHSVSLTGASLSATGGATGGLVRLGGMFQGGQSPQNVTQDQIRLFTGRFGSAEPLAAAQTVGIDPTSSIDVSGGMSGGTAIVWSTVQTNQQGSIKATGATGGAVEVSSHKLLQSDVSKVQVGPGGILLLDPANIVVDTQAHLLAASETETLYAGPVDYDSTSTTSYLDVAKLEALVNGGTDLVLKASNDITFIPGFAVDLSVAHPGNIYLSAGRSVSFGDIVTLSNSSLTVIANDVATNGVDAGQRGSGKAGIDAFSASGPNGFLFGGTGSSGSGGNISLTVGLGLTSGTAGDLRLGGILTSGTGNITLSTSGQSGSKIAFFPDQSNALGPVAVTAAGAVSLTGNFQADTSGGLTVSGQTVTWTDEATAKIGTYAVGTPITFTQAGVVTRYGVTGGGSDITRAALGAGGTAPQYTALYGDSFPAFTAAHVTSGSLHGSDTVATIAAGLNVNFAGPAANSPPGSYNVVVSATPNTAAFPQGYFANLSPVTDTIQILSNVVTPTVTGGSYVYGSPTALVSLSGVIGSDVVVPVASLSGIGSVSLGSVSLASMGSGFGFAPNTAAGTFTYTVTGLSGANASRYTLAAGTFSASLSISPKPISYVISNAASTYGTLASPAATLVASDIVGTDDVGIGTIAGTRNGVTAPLSATMSPGIYALSLASLSGSTAGNYSIAPGAFNGDLTVSPKSLTYSVANANSTYGTLATPPVPVLSGVINSDDVTAVPSTMLGGMPVTLNAKSAAGIYALSVGGLSGAAAANYTIAGAGNTDGVLTIAPLALGFSVATTSQTYGSQSVVVTLSGVLAGDTVSPVITEGAANPPLTALSANAYAYDAKTAAGTHNFTLTGLSDSNYTLNLSTGTSGTLTVLPKNVTYAIADLGTTYGTAPAPSATLTGGLSGDDLSAPVTAKSGTNSVSLGIHTAPGSYSLSVTSLTGGAAGNYVLAGSGNTDATLTIAPRALTYSVGDAGSTYGTLASTGSSTLSSIVPGDTVSGAVTVLQNGAPVTLTDRSAAGTYTLSVLALGGAQASNYVLANSGNRDGTLTIAPKTLNYSLADSTSVYGTMAAPAVSFTGVLSGDSVSGVLGALTFAGIPNGPTFAVTDRTAAGAYQVRLIGLTGTDADNYALGANVIANLTISPLPIHYVIGSSSWVYGDGMTVTDGISLVGVLAGDTVIPNNRVQVFDSTNTQLGSVTGAKVGTYTESIPTGPGAVINSNYVLAATGNTDGVFTITPKPISAFTNLTVAPSQAYGSLHPGDAVSSVTLSGLVYATNVQAVTSFSPQTASSSGHLAVGSYTFSVSGLTGPDAFNYSLGSANSVTLTITPKLLASALGTVTSTYGTLANLPSSVLTGVVSGDQVSGGTISVSRQTGGGTVPVTLSATSPAGSYAIGTSNLTGVDAADYSIGSGSGTLTIAPKSITATAVNSTSTYGTLATLSSPVLTGVVGSDAVQGTYSAQLIGHQGSFTFGTTLGAQTAAGSYTITVNGLTGAGASNYTLAATGSTATLTVSPKPLSYSYASMTQSQVFGAIPASTVQLAGVLAGDDVSPAVTATVTSSPAGDIYNPVGTPRSMGTQLPVGVYNVAMVANGGRYILNGAAAGNYVLANDGVTSLGVVTITPRSLGYAIRAAASQATYGTGDALAVNLTNVVSGATLNYTLVAASSSSATDLGAITGLPQNFPAGTYQLSLRPTQSDAFNYAVATNPTGATVTIAPKSITASVNAAAGTYGTAWIDLADLPGLVTGDTVTPVVSISGVAQPVTLTTTATGFGMASAPSAGSHTVTLNALSGASAGNYTLANPGAAVTVTIAQKELTWSVAPVTGQYGGLSTPSCATFGCEMYSSLNFKPGAATLSGIVNNDSVAANVQLTDGSSVFNYATNTPAGTYIQVVTSLSGAGAANYKLAATGNTGGVMTIQPGWVQVSVSNGGLVYNGTSTTTVGTPGVATVERSVDSGGGLNSGPLYGFVPGDTVSVSIGIFNSDGTPYTGGQPIPAGNYLLESVGLTGAQAGNYRLVGQQNIALYGLTGSTPGQYIVVDNSIFNFSLLGANPNQIYTPPAVNSKPVVTASASASATSTNTATLGLTGGSVRSTDSASATAGVSAGIVSLSAQASATTTNLASFGLTGITVSSTSSASTSVTLAVGPASISYGAGATTMGAVSLSLSQNPSLTISGLAQVGVNDTIGVAGSLGNGVSGDVASNSAVFAQARSSTTIGVKDGTLTVGTQQWAGVGASTGVSGSVSGGGVTGSASVTIYSPGSLGLGATSTSGYKDGTLTLGFSLGISIGIGGLQIAPKISFPTGAIVSTATNVGGIVSYVFTGQDNSCNAACQQANAAQAFADKLATAKKVAMGPANLALVSYLNANPDVVAAARQSFDLGALAIVAAYDKYASIPTQLNSVVTQEQALVTRLQSNPSSISFADLQQAQSLRAQEASLITRTTQLGGKIAVTNGTLSLVPQ